MIALTPERWEVVGPYLDRALDLPAEERAAWLATLRSNDPSLADDLQALLEAQEALIGEGFLDQPPPIRPDAEAAGNQTIGAYTLVSPIGSGGMGTVWLARRSDGRYERRVAVKFPSLARFGTGGGERFRREGNILGRLSHPHIAELIDAGVAANGRPYLVLEHVEGEPIDRACDRKRLDVNDRIRLFLDVLDGVAHAHANLVVHRDIKPTNVLVTDDGQVKLLDFGIAKLLEGNAATDPPTQLTGEGGAAMTPAYAAPEQVAGGPVTTATDVHALGVLLYLLLTGEHPFGPASSSPAALMKAIVETEPRLPSEVARLTASAPATATSAAALRSTTPEKLRRLLRGDLDTIVAKAMRKIPRERYASVTALADDLRRWLKHEPIDARPDTFAYRAAKFARRNLAAVTLAVLALVASVAGVVATSIQARTARAQRDFSIEQLKRAEAINDLNNFLLADAAPSGKPFTVDDLLARAQHIVAREKSTGDDTNRVEALISMGRQYYGMDEDEQSRRVLEEAYARSRALRSPSARAKAACALGSTLSRGEGLPRAEPLIQEGLAELPDEPVYALDRVFCLMCGGEVSRDAGGSEASIARALEAWRVLKNSPFDADLTEVGVLLDLGESYRVAGRNREAFATFEKASTLLVSLGRDDTQTAGTLFNNWALTLDQAGRTLEAEAIYRRAIDLSRDDRGEVAVSPMLLVNYSRTLDNLNRLDQAADYGERGCAKARAAQDDVVVNQALLTLSSTYRKQGRFDRAGETLSEVEPRLRRALPPGHFGFVAILTQRSLLARDQGDNRTAMALASEAVQATEASVKAGKQGQNYLPQLLIRRADIELNLEQYEEAAADAARVVNMLQKSMEPDTFSCIMGRAQLSLGRALLARNRPDDARAALRTAIDHLRNSLGEDHPDTLRARQLLETGTASP